MKYSPVLCCFCVLAAACASSPGSQPAQSPAPTQTSTQTPTQATRPTAGQTVTPGPTSTPAATQAQTPPTRTQTTAAPDAAQAQPFKPEELEQIVAPIALYPDALLAQILMASTYPLEVVQAARWSKAHPEVKGDAVATEMEKQSWDASVKSLVAFPDVLTMMNDKLEWTQKLGDAFLAQQKDVMEAVQRLRAKAKEQGNLESSKEQTVKTEPAPEGAQGKEIIIIESPSPEVVYVPTYNPTVVYGAWPYPAYPPYYYYPPGYAAGAAFFSFSMGVFVGSAMWGGCNWGYGSVDIDVNRYNNFNRTDINRGNINRNNIGNNRSTWQHNSSHRQGVGYRDTATQERYGRSSSQSDLRAREDFRGRADGGGDFQGRDGAGGSQYRDLGGGQSGDIGGSRQGDRAGAGSGQTRGPQSGDLGSSRSGDFSQSASSRSKSAGAFSDVGSASRARASSSRGMSSRGMSRGGGRRR